MTFLPAFQCLNSSLSLPLVCLSGRPCSPHSGAAAAEKKRGSCRAAYLTPYYHRKAITTNAMGGKTAIFTFIPVRWFGSGQWRWVCVRQSAACVHRRVRTMYWQNERSRLCCALPNTCIIGGIMCSSIHYITAWWPLILWPSGSQQVLRWPQNKCLLSVCLLLMQMFFVGTCILALFISFISCKGWKRSYPRLWSGRAGISISQPPTFIAAVVTLKALTADTDCTSTDESSNQIA